MGLLTVLGLKAPKALATVGAKAESATDAPAKADAASLLQRHQKLKPDLDKMVAKGGALAGSLRTQLDDFRKALQAKQLDVATTILDRLEEVVWMETGNAPAMPGGGAAPGGAPADPDEAAIAQQIAAADASMAAIEEQALKELMGAEVDTLRESFADAKAQTDAKKRSAALKALLATAKKVAEKAGQYKMSDKMRRDAEAAKAEVDALVTQITSAVGGIQAAGPRDKVNAELKTLKAGVDKAVKAKGSQAILAAHNALKPAARDLLSRAQAAAGAPQWADGQLKPLLDAAKAATAGLGGAGPRGVLDAEAAAIEADIARFKAANDVASLQKVVAPRLQKLHRFATSLAASSARADAELARAATMIGGFDEQRSADIRAALKALQDQKATAWPAGASVAEMDAGVGAFEASVRRLLADAEVRKLKLDALKDIAALRLRVDGLKPRTDKANETPVPKFVDKAQKDVRDRLAATIAELDKEDLKKAEAAFGGLVTSLDRLETYKSAWERFQKKLADADGGPIKVALDLKLEPADLKKTSKTAIARTRSEIVALAEAGYPTNAGKKVDEWIVSAKAWAGAKEAYDNMRGGKPAAATMAKLAKAPGGGPVLDALVAALPDDIPQDVLTEAVQARYGIKVKQYDHRTNAKKGTTRTAVNPKTPDKALKGLYSVLGKVPLKDTAKVKSIDRYVDEKGGAAYGDGEIDLYCGRPGDGKVQEFNKPGEVVPAGEKVDKNCEPVNPKIKAGYFDFATLHEVGHAVDDKKNIMGGGRNKDAGWLAPSTDTIAGIAATELKYDKAYIKAMLDAKKSVPPARKPAAPKGVDAADWDLARQKAEDWAKSIRVDAGLWWHAAESKRVSIGGVVYQEAYEGEWVSYNLSARAQGVTGYQFRSPAEWFAELYAAFFMEKMNPKHPAASWLAKLKAEAN